MRKISRLFLFGAFTLILLTAACSGQQGSATPAGAVPSDELTSSPTAIDAGTPAPPETTTVTTTAVTITRTATTPTAAVTGSATAAITQTATTNTTLTPKIPVTGEIVLLECQYCIEHMAHALLILPETANFEVVSNTASISTPGPDTGCKAVDTFGGRQTVLCRAPENTSLTLNICANGTNCTQLDVKLQSCPVSPSGTPVGITNTPGAGTTKTPTTGIPSVTNTPVGGTTTTPLPIPSPSSSPTP